MHYAVDYRALNGSRPSSIRWLPPHERGRCSRLYLRSVFQGERWILHERLRGQPTLSPYAQYRFCRDRQLGVAATRF